MLRYGEGIVVLYNFIHDFPCGFYFTKYYKNRLNGLSKAKNRARLTGPLRA